MPDATLSSGWAPPSSCLLPNDFWFYATKGTACNYLGPPNQTSSCLPPSYVPQSWYFGDACPTGFTSACEQSIAALGGGPSQQLMVTCCPTVKPFYCGAGSAEFPQQGHCASELTSVEVRTATLTDFDSSTQDIETATIQTPGVLNAYGVVFLTVTPSSTSSSTVTSNTISVSSNLPPSEGITPSTSVSSTKDTTSSTEVSLSPTPPSADTARVTTTPRTSTSDITHPETSSTSSSLSKGALAGVVVGAVFGAVGVLLVVFFVRKCWIDHSKRRAAAQSTRSWATKAANSAGH